MKRYVWNDSRSIKKDSKITHNDINRQPEGKLFYKASVLKITKNNFTFKIKHRHNW